MFYAENLALFVADKQFAADKRFAAWAHFSLDLVDQVSVLIVDCEFDLLQVKAC
jgi:hypothetical protein